MYMKIEEVLGHCSCTPISNFEFHLLKNVSLPVLPLLTFLSILLQISCLFGIVCFVCVTLDIVTLYGSVSLECTLQFAGVVR